MKWSIELGRILGIRFRIHLTFLVLVGLFGLAGLTTGGLAAGLSAMLFICAVFLCVTVHELAHSVVASSMGIPVDSITLLPIGGVAVMRGTPEEPLQEILISVVGPAASITIFAVMALPLGVGFDEIWPLNPFTTDVRTFLVSLCSVNLVLGLFNLIPAFPMDGGRMLRGLLNLAIGFERATRIATLIGQIFAVGLIVLGGFFFGHLWLMLIGFFIFLGASAEKRGIRIRSILKGVHVGQIMLTGFRLLAPQEPVGTAAESLIHGLQEDFPVVRDGQLIGLLAREAVASALQQQNLTTSVGELMSVDLPEVTPETDLDAARQKMIIGKHAALPVTSDGYFVGIVSQNHIERYLAMQQTVR